MNVSVDPSARWPVDRYWMFQSVRSLAAVAVLVAWLADPTDGRAQEHRVRGVLSLDAVAATEAPLPFWLQANRHGRWDRTGTQGGLLAGGRVRDSVGTTEFTGVLEIAARVGRASSTGYVRRGYLRADRGIFRVTAGRVAHVAGLVDTTLTAGSMMWSPNALPVPRVSVSWPRYVEIPGTGGYAAVRGYLSHGWLGSDRYVENPYLHEKQFYVRVLPERFPVQGHAGVVHNAIWDGTHPVDGELPDGLSHFVKTVLGYRPDRGDTAEDLGNTVAIYDTGITYEAGPIDGSVYREFYIEDKPALWFRSPWDGLWGVSVHLEDRTLPVHGLVWEHVYTVRQGSRYAQGEDPGADNYYNHSVYLSGWTYRGRTIGHPLLFSRDDVIGVANNRIVAHHVGLEGSLGPFADFRALATYSRNYGAGRVLTRTPNGRLVGRNGQTDRRDQYSFLLDVIGRPSVLPVEARLQLAVDLGERRPEGLGVLAGLTYRIEE